MFLDRARGEELFYEKYKKVAVMFAYIENFQPDKVGLRVLNEYICYYDDLLAEYVNNFKVEKIKVMGWTYMAACGLEPENMTDFSRKLPERKRRRRSIFRSKHLNITRSQIHLILFSESAISFLAAEEHELPIRRPFQPRFTHSSLENDDKCVLTMLNFALDMLRIMQDIALQNMYLEYGGSMKGQLKIGDCRSQIIHLFLQ